MPLFLRKSFRAGPIRLNLSKSGLGVSAGVKGLRVGAGPRRRPYIYAGRHGLYYRKTLTGSPAGRSRVDLADTPHTVASSTCSEEIFVDTGVTYPTNIRKSEVQVEPVPQFPSPHKAHKYLYAFGIPTFLIALPSTSVPFMVVGLVLVASGIFVSVYNSTVNKKVRTTTELIAKCSNLLEKEEDINGLVDSSQLGGLSSDFLRVFNWQVMSILLQKYAGRLDAQIGSRILQIRERIGMSDETFRSVKIQTFRQIFDDCMEDHLLEEEEEKSLRDFASILKLSDSDIQEELQSIDTMSQIRREMSSELVPVQADIALRKSENCLYFSPARLIKKKILRTQTVQGTRLKHVGYAVDKEGTVYLTDKRILMVSEGTSSINLDDILHVTVIPEANIVELVLDGRKTPVTLTLEGAMAFAAKVEKAAGSPIRTGNASSGAD